MLIRPSIHASRVTARVIARTAIHPRHRLIILPAARRLQSTAPTSSTGSVTPPLHPPPPGSPLPPSSRRGGPLRSLLRWAVRLIYISAFGGIGYFIYCTHSPRTPFDADNVDAYLSRHPPNTQLSPDPNKKTLVLLGSGWGGTSLLKGLNTEDYNVIVVSPRNYFLFTRKIPCSECALIGSVVAVDDHRIG